MAAGTTDGIGAGMSPLEQGKSREDFWINIASKILTDPTQDDKDCHYPKPILFKLGKNDTNISGCIDVINTNYCASWTEIIIPVQILQLGQLIIPAVPSEWTTMLGRRLKQLIAKTFTQSHIAIAGLSNV